MCLTRLRLATGRVMDQPIRIAWVDPCQLTRECITAALSQDTSPLRLTPYEQASSFIVSTTTHEVDLIVLTTHDLGCDLPQDVLALRSAGFRQPIVLVSPNEATEELEAVAASLRLGACGHLPLRSTGIGMAISSLLFAYEGGSFAPLQLLLAPVPVPVRGTATQRRLTRANTGNGKPGGRGTRPRKSAGRLATATLMEGNTHDESA